MKGTAKANYHQHKLRKDMVFRGLALCDSMRGDMKGLGKNRYMYLKDLVQRYSLNPKLRFTKELRFTFYSDDIRLRFTPLLSVFQDAFRRNKMFEHRPFQKTRYLKKQRCVEVELITLTVYKHVLTLVKGRLPCNARQTFHEFPSFAILRSPNA